MTIEDFLYECEKRLLLPLMETDCILTSLLFEGSVRNY